jgi:hypothetical protein
MTSGRPPSSRTHLIGLGCHSLMRTHLYRNLAYLTHVPFKKNHDILIPRNISIFDQYGTMMVLFQWISSMHILSHFIAWVKLLFLILFMTIFWPELFQEPRYLLWFILINLINCGASQSTNVLMVFFLQWAIWLAYHQKIMKSPFRNHIYLFHLHRV